MRPAHSIGGIFGLAIWQHTEKVEHGWIPLSNGIKTVSVFQRLQGEIVHSNFVVYKPVVHKHDVTSVTEQTSRQKLNVFGRPSGGRNPSSTKLGIRVPRARSFTSKHFGFW